MTETPPGSRARLAAARTHSHAAASAATLRPPMADLLEGFVARLRGPRRHLDAAAVTFEAERRALVGRRLIDLDADTLGAVLARLDADADGAAASIAALRRRSDAALADADWREVEGLRGRAVDLGRAFDELQELRRQVEDARQQRILHDRLAARLGSQRRRVLYDAFIMALITAVIAILLFVEIAQPPAATVVILDMIDIGACVIFLADFFWRRSLADDRRWFWRRHWIDFITSIPLPSMHTLRLGRSLRLVRFLRLLRLARAVRVLLFFWRGMDKLAAAFDVRMMRRSIAILVTVLFLGALGIWLAEGGRRAEGVESFEESLWWSFTTVVTGGFGDIRNPETLTGRLLTALLIIAGMVVVGIFTATLTSLLVREGDVSGEILALEERMLGELRRLRADLARLGGPRGDAQGVDETSPRDDLAP